MWNKQTPFNEFADQTTSNHYLHLHRFRGQCSDQTQTLNLAFNKQYIEILSEHDQQ